MLTINAKIKNLKITRSYVSDGDIFLGEIFLQSLFKFCRHPCFSKKNYHRYRISHLLTIFATIPHHSSGQDGHFSKKVLLKLSSKIKFSQNLKRYEDDSSSTTSLVCTVLSGSLHNLWCGLLFYPYRRQCEKPDFRIKQ